MNTRCYSFRQIPQTTRLFNDFLYDFPKVSQFYSRSPHFRDWMASEAEAASTRYDSTRRDRVATALEAQNRAWGASEKTLENLRRFRAGADAAVSGQQVGLFGGPLYSLFKALTAVRMAEEATAAGIECVPVFWLATEDHDLAEVNHATLLGTNGAPQRLTAATTGKTGAPMSEMLLGAEITAVVESMAGLVGDQDVVAAVRDAYRPGETLASAFAKLYTRLFAPWGLILLDPADAALHEIARPVFRTAVEKAAEIGSGLLDRGQQLVKAGYHEQVKVTATSTLLFAIRNGVRIPVHQLSRNGATVFEIGKEKISPDEMLKLVEADSANLNANVLLRPVMQDYLLPTIAYAGGPAEIAYFAQIGVVQQAILNRVTPIIPRFSATLVEAKSASLLDRHHLALEDLFQGEENLRNVFAARSLPQALTAAFASAERAIGAALAQVRDGLSKLDPTLVEAEQRAESKIRYQIHRLQQRATREEARRNEVISRHAAALSNVLYPKKSLQERGLGGISFLGRNGLDLLPRVLENIHTDCVDHQALYL